MNIITDKSKNMGSRIKAISFLLLILPGLFSCRKIRDYFDNPETEVLSQTIETCYAVAYSANLTIRYMKGENISNISGTGRCSNFPCTSLNTIDMMGNNSAPYMPEGINKITIAGLWVSSEEAIFSILFSKINIANRTIELLGVNTVPVIRKENNYLVALAGNDISLTPDKDAFLTLDLSKMQIESEFQRLNEIVPSDLYVAVEQKAFFIEIDENNTNSNSFDDNYKITGGGQLLEVTENSAVIFQQAMIDLVISDECIKNPVSGHALIRKIKTNDNSFPEMGTAILEFHESCDQRMKVILATGSYIGSIDKTIEYNR